MRVHVVNVNASTRAVVSMQSMNPLVGWGWDGMGWDGMGMGWITACARKCNRSLQSLGWDAMGWGVLLRYGMGRHGMVCLSHVASYSSIIPHVQSNSYSYLYPSYTPIYSPTLLAFNTPCAFLPRHSRQCQRQSQRHFTSLRYAMTLLRAVVTFPAHFISVAGWSVAVRGL